MRVIFLGTPDFAAISLEAVYNSRHQVIAVVTQPDKPVGRRAELQISPVKKFALEHGIRVLQYDKISKEGVDELSALEPDIMVTCAYGQILSKEVLSLAKHGVINVHASLLPKYRGASPIQYAVLNGDEVTGVTIMQTEEGLDSGDIILSEGLEIMPNETSGELFDRIAPLGARLVVRALDLIESGEAAFTPQDNSKATYVKQLKKSDGLIDFSRSFAELHNFVRGMLPWPCAYTFLNGKMLKIYKISRGELSKEFADARCGTVVSANPKTGLLVKTGDGAIRLDEVQLEGGRRMTASEFTLGRRVAVGDVLAK